MLPYYSLLAIWLLGAIQFSSLKRQRLEGVLYAIALIYTVLLIGLRYEVGGDYESYLSMYKQMYFQPLSYAITATEPAYGFLNWVSIQFDGGTWPVNLACGTVFILGLSSLARQQKNPWLAFGVATPYLIIVVGMGYTRQACAIGIICWTISRAPERGVKSMILGIAAAALFHKTAILMLPVLVAPLLARRPILAAFGMVATVGLAAVTVGQGSDAFVTNYVSSNYQSTGAAIRIGMNVVSAGIFLLFGSRFDISQYHKSLWRYFSVLSILSVAGLMAASSSVGVDRLSLFLLPLQLVVYSQIPYALSKHTAPVTSIFISVICYNIVVMYAYFVLATFSWAWVPYQNIVFSDTTVHRLD